MLDGGGEPDDALGAALVDGDGARRVEAELHGGAQVVDDTRFPGERARGACEPKIVRSEIAVDQPHLLGDAPVVPDPGPVFGFSLGRVADERGDDGAAAGKRGNQPATNEAGGAGDESMCSHERSPFFFGSATRESSLAASSSGTTLRRTLQRRSAPSIADSANVASSVALFGV